MTKRASKPEAAQPSLRPPTEPELQSIAQARERQAERPARVQIKSERQGTVSRVGPPHSDGAGWSDAILDAWGTRDHSFVEIAMVQLDATLRGRGEGSASDGKANFALAVLGAVQPKDELEAILAAQMIAVHELAMDSTARAKHADNRDARSAYTTDAVKLTRTFAAQMEALTKLRAGGKQQVEVRYVYVDARGSQNVIGDVHAHGGGGAGGNVGQPHAPQAPVPGGDAALWGAHTLGNGLPLSGGAGPVPLPDARGQESGSAEGRGEQQLPPRTALGRVHRSAPARPRARAAG